jgi:dihydrofolate synthase/folylpolyglutamate synthase
MTYQEAIHFLYDLRLFGLKLGLENTFKLAALAGNPHEKLRFIHVAGTNGKGSTCAMLESIYRAARLRVGLFTSPHLVSFRERIQVNRQLISEADVVRLVGEIRRPGRPVALPALQPGITTGGTACENLKPAERSCDFTRVSTPPSMSAKTSDGSGRRDACPTFFEFVTVMALRYFADQQCDLVIWETGMGGRLDATNIVTPLASVITNVELDHQQWLGDTRAQIAAEKAGIIKPGVPVITATDAPEALEVIETTAKKLNAPLFKMGQASIRSWSGKRPDLPLLGGHQRLNAALAVKTVEVLREKIPVSEASIQRGLETVQWPGRMQLVNTVSGQLVLLDGAHNASSAEALCEVLRSGKVRRLISRRRHRTKDRAIRQDAGGTLILGVLADKDWAPMCATLAPLAKRILLAPVSSERTAAPGALHEACVKANPTADTLTCPSLADALKHAADDPFVIITGSLYLVGEAMELLKLLPATVGSERGLNEWTLKK